MEKLHPNHVKLYKQHLHGAADSLCSQLKKAGMKPSTFWTISDHFLFVMYHT